MLLKSPSTKFCRKMWASAQKTFFGISEVHFYTPRKPNYLRLFEVWWDAVHCWLSNTLSRGTALKNSCQKRIRLGMSIFINFLKFFIQGIRSFQFANNFSKICLWSNHILFPTHFSIRDSNFKNGRIVCSCSPLKCETCGYIGKNLSPD